MYIYVAIAVTEKPLQGSVNKVKSNQIKSKVKTSKFLLLLSFLLRREADLPDLPVKS